jgi:hypothetical protein
MTSPPAFAWDDWYAAVGGRSIRIPEVTDLLQRSSITSIRASTVKVAADAPGVFLPRRGRAASKEKRSSSVPISSAFARSSRATCIAARVIDREVRHRGRTAHALARVSGRALEGVSDRMPARVLHPRRDGDSTRCYIRSIGYACKVEHPIGDSDLLHIPIGLKAGFGELGRHGSNHSTDARPAVRMGSVITSIELETDHPIDAGIAKFCDFGVARAGKLLSPGRNP